MVFINHMILLGLGRGRVWEVLGQGLTIKNPKFQK